jgi:hypothetical protein
VVQKPEERVRTAVFYKPTRSRCGFLFDARDSSTPIVARPLWSAPAERSGDGASRRSWLLGIVLNVHGGERHQTAKAASRFACRRSPKRSAQS